MRASIAALALLLGGCAAEVPSGPTAPGPTSAERARAASLLREGLRAQNPPRGGTPDSTRAAELIEEAATLGDPDAQLMVATSHLSPAGGNNARAAIPWLLRAAEQGQPEAQFRLARLIEAGEGTAREPAWAAVWFQRAAERGVAQAHYALALMQIAGAGLPRDEAAALARLRIAEQGGVTAARRYRVALEPRVPAAEATAALARLRGETSRGPVRLPDRPLVRFAQSALVTLGAAPGLEVDGLDGPATRTALTGFARREGIAAGPWDAAVIDRLRDRLPRS